MQVVRIASLKPNKLFTEHSKKLSEYLLHTEVPSF